MSVDIVGCSYSRSPGCDRKKVVILEDAESLLMQRAPDNQAHVSALLNMSDGLLGDVLKLHLICAVNCSLGKIDGALLSLGRLLRYREFKRLSNSRHAP
jgi:hypothetical protein